MIKRISLFLFLLGFSSFAGAEISEVKLYKNEHYVTKIKTYLFGEQTYFDSGEIIKKFGGKTQWYSVSGKLIIQMKSHKIQVNKGSDLVKFDEDSSESVANVLLVRAGRIFLSKDFFTSSQFSRTMGFRVEYDEKAKTLKIFENINISSIRYFSYSDKTRVVVYLYEKLEFKTSRMERKNFILSVLNGSYPAQNEKLEVNDGVVKGIEFNQEEKSARFAVSLDENFGDVETFTLPDPDRIVMDFKADEGRVRNKIGLGKEEEVKVIIPESSTAAISASTISAILPDKMTVDKKGVKKVVIDPGHGGKDPGGKRYFGLKEKELNLLVAKELYALLKGEKSFDVLLTRNSDVFIPLNERSRMANDFGADIFISIHANASRSRKEKGFEIYFLSERASDPWSAEVADYENSVVSFESETSSYDPAALVLHSLAKNEYINEGSQLAAHISKECEKGTPFNNRGIKQAAFYVLRGVYSPGVLVEMGFMTNSTDQNRMNDAKVRKKLAKAVYNGVMKYAQSKGW